MTYSITTLGCKVNQYETQAMQAILDTRGHSEACGCADAVIINTCAVTSESTRKSRQAIRRAQKQNPGAVVAVCGCFSQLSPERVTELGADLVSGSGDRSGFVARLENLVSERERGREPALFIDDPSTRRVFEQLPAGEMAGRTRAMLKIEDGCDNFCAYCIIPYARGPVRSLPLSDAKAQAAALHAEGFREIVITGIEISSYGKDFHDGTSLIDVVSAISEVAPATRLRLGSLEPTIVTESFCEKLADLGNVCPHFHLSLQSGCDEILRAMGRKYDTARFFEAASLLRRYFPASGLTADLITGFPGETAEHFARTLAFIEKCAFSAMHVFPYSEREGTRAAEMPGAVPRAEREGRAKEAIKVAERMEQSFLASCAGKVLSVLFETEEEGLGFGHAGNYALVKAPCTGKRGHVENVEIKGVSGQVLVGDYA